MSNFLLIVFCLVAGWAFRYFGLFPDRAHLTLNAFVINLSLPAVALYHVPKLHLTAEMLLPFLTSWVVILLAFPFFWLLARWLGLPRATLGALLLTCGFGNVSFVGYPITQAFYGEAGVQVTVFVDQGGFLALSLIGVPMAMVYGDGKPSVRVIAQKTLAFPPFVAFLLALGLLILGIRLPSAADGMLQMLGQTLTPLSLTSVGLQVSFDTSDIRWRDVWLGLAYKLGIAPLVLWGLAALLLDLQSLAAKVSIVEAAMPPMVTASILASQYRLDPPLASLMVGFGLLVSLPLLAVWYWLLG